MKVSDAIAEILKIEGAEFLSCFPTTVLLDASAKAGLRPVICRQERVGVGIADGYSISYCSIRSKCLGLSNASAPGIISATGSSKYYAFTRT